MESKKQLILLVLNELNANTDKNNPETQTQIAKNITGKDYKCDRKTVCRNIKFLQEMGYPIKKTTKGFYVDKEFPLDEVTYVKAAIMSAEGKSEIEKEELANKVAAVLTNKYRR